MAPESSLQVQNEAGARNEEVERLPRHRADPDAGAPPTFPEDDVVDDPWAGQGLAAFLFEEGSIHDFSIELDDDARHSLGSAPETDVLATFSYRGFEWDVGFRLKGTSSFRTLDGKPSFKVDFHEWNEYASFYGKKRLTLNSMVQDPTLMREHAYYWLCAQLGVAAPRHGYARVRVNGEDYGLYGIVETMDEEFIDRAWPDDDEGGLWEGSGSDVTLARDWFDVDEVGIGDIDALVMAVENTEAWLPMLQEQFAVDALFTYWALDVVSGNQDGYTFNHHNYHLYYAPVQGRWWMIPWGTDRSFGKEEVPVHGSSTLPILGAMVLGCLSDDECEERFDRSVIDMADAWDSLGLYAYVEATEAAIAESAEADPRREYAWRPDDLEDFVRMAPNAVRDQLGD